MAGVGGLSEFYSKFSSSAGKFVDTIDPLNSFDLTFEFSPNAGASNSGKGGSSEWYEELGDMAVSMAKSAATNALNNITGGLYSSVVNDKDIKEEHDKFGAAGKQSFVEYLAPANLVSEGDSPVSPLILNLGPYVQKVTIPRLTLQEDVVKTSLGEFPVNGMFVKPDNNSLTMDVLNTKVPLLERIFYPWLREVTLPYWSYDNQPYTTATITVDMRKHADIYYRFYGARPVQINTYQPSQELNSTFTRSVTFTFDFMAVLSDLKTVESAVDKLKQLGTSLLNGALNML